MIEDDAEQYQNMVWPEGTMGEVEFSIESTTTTNSFPLDPNILWGVAATALAGATLAEWERQREEERRRAEEGQLEKRKNTEKRRDQKKAEDAVRERWAQEKAAKIEQAKQAAYNQHVAVLDYVEAARLAAIKESIQREKEEQKNEKEKAAYEQRMGEHGYDPVKVGGPKVLAMPVQDDDPPKWWDIRNPDWTFVGAVQDILGIDPNYQPAPTAMPTATLKPWWFTPSPTPTPTLQQTATSVFTVTPRPTSSYLEDQLRAYGIQVVGADSSLATTLLQAVNISSEKFSLFTGGTPQQSFIMSHGTLAIIIDKDADITNGICETEHVVPNTRYWPSGQLEPDYNVGQTITCTEAPTLTNTLHEFGHAFDNNYKTFGNPEHLLSDYMSDLKVGDAYIRQVLPGNVIRTSDGFKGDKDPSLENYWSPSLIEEFGDTYLNAVLDGTEINQEFNGFSDDQKGYGDVRRDEWNSLIERWKNDMQSHFDSFDK
jgi:hypothetical protein